MRQRTTFKLLFVVALAAFLCGQQAACGRPAVLPSALLDSAFAALAEHAPDKIDFYFLGVAGDGAQAIFCANCVM